MRKITSILMLLTLFVSTSWAETIVKSIGSPVTTLESIESDTWYVLYNFKRAGCVSEETTEMKMRANIAVNDVQSEILGKLFKFAKQTDGKYYIQSGNGKYFSLSHDASSISETPVSFIMGIRDNKGHFYLQDATTNYIADGQDVGGNFVGWGTGVPSGDCGNNCYQIFPVEFAEGVQVTYNYMYGGVQKKSVTVWQEVGTPVSAPAYDFVTIANPEGTISGTGTNVYDVTCTDNLPFEKSASYDNAKWYIVDMHSNDTGAGDINSGEKRYVWTFDASKTYNVSLPKAESKQVSLFGDEKLWCFVGNPFDGFEIYNKAAGSSMKLYRKGDGDGVVEAKKDNVAQMSSDNTTKFILAPSSAIEGAACFKPVGHTYYLNTQANNNVDNGLKYLSGWTATDGGSSCRFFAPTDFVKDMVDMWLSIVGYVGAPVALNEAAAETLTNLSAALTEDGWNTAVVTEEITTLLTSLKNETNFIVPEEGKYYRILSAVPGFNKNKAIDRNASNELRWDTKNPDRIEQIWTLSPVDGGYAMQSLKDDMYPGTATPVTLSFDATVLELTDLGSAQFKLKTNGSSNPFHANGHGGGNGSNGNIISYDAGANSASAWYIVEVTDKTEQELARMQLSAFYEDNVASMPELSTDAEQIIWPGEIGDKSKLFPTAQALIEKTDATAEEMFASVADIRAFRNEVRNYGALASVVYTFGAEYGTLLSPVPAALPDGVKVYTCEEVNDQNQLVLKTAIDGYGKESIEANKAYILQGTVGKTFQLIGWNKQPADNADQTTGILTGVYEAKEAPAESYVLLNKNGKLGFYRVVAGNQPTVSANRCYITPDASEAPAFFFADGTQTGIESIESGVKAEQVFDLSGRRVNAAKKGLYIVNGKKMMVK